MKRSIQISVVSVILALIALPVMGHHPAEGIVDEEVYAMIDSLVEDAPHATLDLERCQSPTYDVSSSRGGNSELFANNWSSSLNLALNSASACRS